MKLRLVPKGTAKNPVKMVPKGTAKNPVKLTVTKKKPEQRPKDRGPFRKDMRKTG